MAACKHCDGTGVCPVCKGAGYGLFKKRHRVLEEFGHEHCPECHGTGKCRACSGKGV